MKKLFLLAVTLIMLCFSSCQVIGDIFKTGVGVGVFLVIIVIAVIIFIVSKVSGGSK